MGEGARWPSSTTRARPTGGPAELNAYFVAARIIATIPALSGGGSVGQAATSAASSGSVEAFSGSISAPGAARTTENVVFSGKTGGSAWTENPCVAGSIPALTTSLIFARFRLASPQLP